MINFRRPITATLICSLSALWASAALAGSDQPSRVLELFTSQGCSACPPANAFSGKAAEDPSTLVLSYGVTYWDYKGWKDTFAKPEFTDRQHSYGRSFDNDKVYTPQMILNGSAHGSRYSKRDVRSMSLPASQPGIMLTKEAGILRASTVPGTPAVNHDVLLVEYVPGPQSVPVKSGENRGRIITLTNVVTDVKNIGRWEGSHAISTQENPQDGKAYALLLQEPGTMKITAAARYQP